MVSILLTHADYRRTIIVKRQFQSQSRRELFRCNEAFTNEIAAYTHLIPQFKTSIQNLPENPLPLCIFAGNDGHDDIVIMEDLRLDGYRMANRLVGLDLEHSRMVMEVFI